MLSPGLRLVLAVAAPLVGAVLVHELRRRHRTVQAIALLAIAACIGFAVTVLPGVSGGGTVERTFGAAIPGVNFTARGDVASVAVLLMACGAALLALPRHRDDGGRLSGLLLCLGGTATVAAAGNVALLSGGVEMIAAGTVLLRGRGGPGTRSGALLAGLLVAAGLAIVAAAAQLVAVAGTSDLAFVPQGVIAADLAVPWALGGAALVAASAVRGPRARPGRDWAAVGTLPAGFLVLLRLQETAGGQLPPAASGALAVGGAVLGCAAATSALRGAGSSSAARAAAALLIGILISLFGDPLADTGTILAGLLLVTELALIAAPSWALRPTGWSAVVAGLLALPGGAAFAVTAAGLGAVAHQGAGAFPQLLVLSGGASAVAIAGARAVVAAPRSWWPAVPGAVVAGVGLLAGGLLPGGAVRSLAGPFAGGAPGIDVDGGTIAVAGGGFAAGYYSVAAVTLLLASAAALLIVTDRLGSAPVPAGAAEQPPRLRLLLTARRRSSPGLRWLGSRLGSLEEWLEAQPRAPMVVIAAALAVLLFR